MPSFIKDHLRFLNRLSRSLELTDWLEHLARETRYLPVSTVDTTTTVSDIVTETLPPVVVSDILILLVLGRSNSNKTCRWW